MALNLQQLQRQTQRLIMTPQMQQSIQLLQLNAIELEQLTQQELLENPFLTLEEAEAPTAAEGPESANGDDAGPREMEDVGTGSQLDEHLFDAMDGRDYAAAGETITTGDADYAAEGRAADLALDAGLGSPGELRLGAMGDERGEDRGLERDGGDGDYDGAGDGGDSASVETREIAEDMQVAEPPSLETVPEQFDQVDLNWDDYYSDAENSSYTHEDIEERDFSEYVASRTSLSDHLSWQLRCSTLDGVDAEIGYYLIGSLNEDGYLAPEIIGETAEEFKVPLEQVERVLSILQEFDPPGIFARSLPECLLIQMKTLGSYSELAREVLESHLVEFQKKKYRELARQLNVSEETLIELYHKVCRLEPPPGRSMTTDSVQYIQPDVYVKNVDGELMIYLNEGQTGRLSVDRFYHRLLRQQAQAFTQQDKDYALEKYRAALTLIKNIEKRKSTILRVTEAIMEVQRVFLDKGIEALRPLTLREVADMVGMHESTVARVTSRKYVETPQGSFPLKFFFSSSIETQDGGDAVSSRSIKDKLSQIIGGEDPKRPLSDQKIAEMLNKEGFDIARRTVAKYREQLKILPAKYRRQS